MKIYKTDELTVKELLGNLDKKTVEQIVSNSFIAEYERGEIVSKIADKKSSFVLGGGY